MAFARIGSYFSRVAGSARSTATSLMTDAAYRARGFGSNTFKSRLAVGGTFLGAGIGMSVRSGRAEDDLRSYYGEERFTSHFGGGFDTLQSMGMVGGIVGGIFGFKGTDPLSRLGRSVYRQTEKLNLMAARSAYFQTAGRRAGATFRGGNFSVGIENKIRGANQTVRGMYDRIVGSIRPLYNLETIGRAGRPLPRARPSPFFNNQSIGGINVQLGGGLNSPARAGLNIPRPASGPINLDVRMPFGSQPRQVPFRNTPEIRRVPQYNPLRDTVNRPLGDYPMFDQPLGSSPRLSPPRRTRPSTIDQVVRDVVGSSDTRQFSTYYGRQERAALKRRLTDIRSSIQSSEMEIASLGAQPRLSSKYALGLGFTMLGTGGVTGAMGQALGSEATQKVVMGGLLLGGYKIGKEITKAGGLPVTALSIGTASIVGMSASRANENMPQEGTITDISMNTRGGDGVSKMNFSTAGLVFALHNANRRYQ